VTTKLYQRKSLQLKSTLLFLFLVISPVFSIAGELSTYDIVLSGKACKEYPNQEISCDFKVGNDLHFILEGIGSEWTGITFMKSDYEGDFYATYGLGHGCVVVKRGKKNWKNAGCGGPGSAFDYAFISSKNGKVYRDWEACQEVK
jgi:hypothetical protein